ncbi:MAG: DUF1571 domain-containing protein [Planctomycetota bacterium]
MRIRTAAPAITLALLAIASPARAGEEAPRFEPVYRVNHEEQVNGSAAGQQPEMVAARVNPNPEGFNFAQRPGEHPLMPALRFAKLGLQNIDANIQDYSALLYKQERVNDVLNEEEVAFVKVRHQPFSVYMYFLKPHKGRECLYVDPQNGEKGKLYAMDCGWRRRLGVFPLDPDGALAMKGQKYPITKIGIRNLTTELIDVATNDTKFAECEVVVGDNVIMQRPVKQITVTHPVPRRNFRFHKAEVFIDKEMQVPIRYAAYLWPKNPGEAAPLEEAYTYVNIKTNNGFTDADFDKDNPNLFKK